MPTTPPNKPKLGADGKRVKTFVLDTNVFILSLNPSRHS